ncbi:MAG: transporter substrate-binding domain-containing protein [Clostridia bacterium]|nr:transporter substrate-binding domain-containing protein [Clostridia bacterium]
MKKSLVKIITLILTVALFATLASVFVGCGNSKKSQDKLYVGLECAYSPFNYTLTAQIPGAVPIYNSNYARQSGAYAYGYDVQIAQKIADSLGRELVVVKLEWDALIPAVKAGTIDLIIAGMSPTAARKESIDFSDVYYESQLVVVVRKDGAFANASSLSDLAGAKIVAQNGTFHNDALQAQASAHGIVAGQPMEDFPEMINALNTRAIDGYVAEEPGAIENCASNDSFTYIHLQNNSTGFIATADDVAIAVGLKKGNSLLDSVNQALAGISQQDRAQMMQDAITKSNGAVE